MERREIGKALERVFAVCISRLIAFASQFVTRHL